MGEAGGRRPGTGLPASPAPATSPAVVSLPPLWLPAPVSPDISDISRECPEGGSHRPASSAVAVGGSRRRPTRRDLLARVGVLARQSNPARHGPPALDLFAEAWR